MKAEKSGAAEESRGPRGDTTTSDDDERSVARGQMQEEPEPGALADEADEARHLDNEAEAARDFLDAAAAAEEARRLFADALGRGDAGDAQETLLGAAWASRLASIARHDSVAERFVREVVRHIDEDAAARLASAHPALARPASLALAAQARADAERALEGRERAVEERERDTARRDEDARDLAQLARGVLERHAGGEPDAAALVAGPATAAVGDLRGADLPSVPFVIANILPREVARIVAPGKLGKSTLLLHMAEHVVTGRPWFGHEIEQPGGVLIVTAEDSREEVLYRLQRIAKAMTPPLSDSEWQAVASRIFVEDFAGQTHGRVVVADDRGRIEEAPAVQAIIDAYRGHNLSLVLLDPLSLLGAGERFVNDGDIEVARVARRMGRELGACIQIVHHVAQAVVRNGILDQYAGRGGTAGADNSRALWQLADAPTGEHEPQEVAFARQDGAEVLALYFHAVSHRPRIREPLIIRRAGWVFDSITTSAPLRADPTMRAPAQVDASLVALLDLMRRADPPRGFAADELDAASSPRTAARAARARAEREGLIEAREEPSGRRGRTPTVYWLTRAGR